EQRDRRGSPNTADPHAYAISVLKNEAEACRALLHQRSNALLPIARLPPEIMIQILREILEDGWGDVPMMLHAMLRVSREWRTLVEETPRLWCNIDLERSFAGPSYLTTALERSQNLLLTINYHHQFTRAIRPEFLFGEICKHVKRWRSVQLCLNGDSEDFSLLNGALPKHLEILQINILENPGPHLSFCKNRRPPILKDIRLGGCTVDWDSGLLKDLRSLDLGSSYPGVGPSIAQLLGALHQCPELERLRLHFVDFSSGSPFPQSSASSIHLPNLKGVFLWIGYPAMFRILAAVHIPACRVLDLRTSVPRDQWPIFATEALEPHISVISSISKAAINVKIEWRNGLTGVSTKSGMADFGNMTLSFGGISEHQAQVLDWLTENTGIEAIGVPITLKLGISLWTDDIVNILIRLKCVVTMEITSDPWFQRQLLVWLGTPLRDAGSDTKESFPLPQLAVLEGLSGYVGGGILNMVQSRHGHSRLGLIAKVELPSPLKRINLRLDGEPALDRGFFRQLEEAMDGGEVLAD
ncbi:hypothetical protein FRC01_009009, partial [Tulasnella sp. 417]